MKETQSLGTLIADRFREVMLNGKMIAFTNVKQELEKTDLSAANTKIANLNTISALTFHLNYYIGGVLEVLKDGPLSIKDKYSFEMSPMTNENEWNELKAMLYQNSEEFAKEVESLSDDDLRKSFVDVKYGGFYRNLEGMTEHGYYHLGQIVLIRKMIENSRTV